MTKILSVSTVAWDATAWYRSSGIIPDLSKRMGIDFHAFQGRQFTWAQLMSYEIIFFQRPMTEDHLKLAEYVKDLGIKVWVDYDDNLFALPYEARAFLEYNNKVKQTMAKLLMIADHVTVSTGELKRFFSEELKITSPITVVPNALDLDVLPCRPVDSFNADSKVMVWRGSETHWFDVECFSTSLYEAMKDSTDVWHFMGWVPASLMYTDVQDKIRPHKGEDILIYNGNLKKIKPRVMHVPLVDNQLNRAKSNIAWIEATCAGAVTIAPNWPEWQKPGVICYDTPEDYTKLLKGGGLDYAKCWRDSMDYINKNLLLSKVNEKRVEIINGLLGQVTHKYTVTDPYLQVE